MDGKGAWRDNALVERLWRSVQYEEAYLYACDSDSVSAAGEPKDVRRPARKGAV